MKQKLPTLSKFYKAKMFIEYYNKVKTPSGRCRWALVKTEGPRVITHEYYNNIILAVPYFRRRISADDKSREYLRYAYTQAGYMPIRNTSISPGGDKKIIRHFEILDIESEG